MWPGESTPRDYRFLGKEKWSFSADKIEDRHEMELEEAMEDGIEDNEEESTETLQEGKMETGGKLDTCTVNDEAQKLPDEALIIRKEKELKEKRKLKEKALELTQKKEKLSGKGEVFRGKSKYSERKKIAFSGDFQQQNNNADDVGPAQFSNDWFDKFFKFDYGLGVSQK